MFFFFICFCLFFFGEPSTSLPPSLQPPPPFPFPPPKNMGFRSRCWKQVLPNLLSVLLRLIDPSFGATPRRPPIPPPSDRGYSYRVSAVAARTAATGLVASSAATVVGMAIGRSPRAYAVPVAANVTIVGAVMFGTRGCSCVNRRGGGGGWWRLGAWLIICCCVQSRCCSQCRARAPVFQPVRRPRGISVRPPAVGSVQRRPGRCRVGPGDGGRVWVGSRAHPPAHPCLLRCGRRGRGGLPDAPTEEAGAHPIWVDACWSC